MIKGKKSRTYKVLTFTLQIEGLENVWVFEALEELANQWENVHLLLSSKM